MHRTSALIAMSAVAIALAGCGSLGSSTAAGAPASAAGAPSSAPSAAAPCTTHACIAADAEGLKGTVAKDNAVMTKVACTVSTVRQIVSGTYTVHCTVTYSDGMVARGIASVLTAGSGQVDWEPTDIINDGSGG